jgi:hypothetical protein
MKDNQDIKNQINIIRDLINSKNPNISEHISEIKKTYLVEDAIRDTPNINDRYNVPGAVEDEIEDTDGKSSEFEQGYRISGGLLVLHGNSTQDVELTTDDKKNFQETMDEFVSEVSDLVNFGQLNDI